MRSLCLFYIICLPRPIFPNQLSDNIIVKEVKKEHQFFRFELQQQEDTKENTTELSRSTRYTKVSNTTENTRNTKEELWNISTTIASSDYETLKPNMTDKSVMPIQSKNATIRGRSISRWCSTTSTGKNQQPLVLPADSTHLWVTWAWSWFHRDCSKNRNSLIIASKDLTSIPRSKVIHSNKIFGSAIIEADPCLRHSLSVKVFDKNKATKAKIYNEDINKISTLRRIEESDFFIHQWRGTQRLL